MVDPPGSVLRCGPRTPGSGVYQVTGFRIHPETWPRPKSSGSPPIPLPYPPSSRVLQVPSDPPSPKSAVSVFIAVRGPDVTSLPKGIVSLSPAFRAPHTCSRHEPRGRGEGAASPSGAAVGEGAKLPRLREIPPGWVGAPPAPLGAPAPLGGSV